MQKLNYRSALALAVFSMPLTSTFAVLNPTSIIVKPNLKETISLSHPATWGDKSLQIKIVTPSFAAKQAAHALSLGLNGVGAKNLLVLDAVDSSENIFYWTPRSAVTLLSTKEAAHSFEQRAQIVLTQIIKLLPEYKQLDLRINAQIKIDSKHFSSYRFDRYHEGILIEEAFLKVDSTATQLIQIEDRIFKTAQVLVINSSHPQALQSITEDAQLSASDSIVNDGLRVFKLRILGKKLVQLVPVEKFVVQKNKPLGAFEYAYDLNARAILSLHNQYVFEDKPSLPKENAPVETNETVLKGQILASVYPRTALDIAQLVPMPFARLQIEKSRFFANELGFLQLSLRLPANVPEQPTEAFAGLVPADFKIRGKYVAVRDEENVDRNITQAIGDDFNVLFSDENSTMAERMVYVNVNKIRLWALKYAPDVAWLQQTLAVHVNINSVCNAFWNGISLNFFKEGGEGEYVCSNTGEIADIAFHEWGHGFHHNTSGIKDFAYSEGIGDIAAMLQTRSPVLGPNFFKNGKEVRDMRKLAVYPQDKGEVHAEGQIIGGTFWDLYQGLLAKYEADVAIDMLSTWFVSAVRATSAYTQVYRHLLAFEKRNNPEGSLLQGPHFCILNSAFAKHGLAVAEPVCAQ